MRVDEREREREIERERERERGGGGEFRLQMVYCILAIGPYTSAKYKTKLCTHNRQIRHTNSKTQRQTRPILTNKQTQREIETERQRENERLRQRGRQRQKQRGIDREGETRGWVGGGETECYNPKGK